LVQQLNVPFRFDAHGLLSAELIPRNRLVCLQELGSCWLVCASTDLQQLAEMALTRLGISSELGGTRCSIKRVEAPRLLGQCGFELLQGLRQLFHFQKHFARQFARWGQRSWV
jgi:hypothetical protein